MQKGSGYILNSTPLQTFAVYTAINNVVYLCPNPWRNNSKASLFLGAVFFHLAFSFVFTKNECFLCALFGRVTTFSFLFLKYTMLKTLWNKQVRPKLINTIIENNPLHGPGAKSML